MYSIQLELAAGLALAMLALGGLGAVILCRRVYGAQVRSLKSRLSRSEAERHRTLDLLDQAEQRIQSLRRKLSRAQAQDSGPSTSSAWIEVPEVRVVDTREPYRDGP